MYVNRLELYESSSIESDLVTVVKDDNGFVFYKCRFCGLTFNYMNTLRAHERVHNVSQGYKCECGRTFYSYTEMLYHKHPADVQEQNEKKINILQYLKTGYQVRTTNAGSIIMERTIYSIMYYLLISVYLFQFNIFLNISCNLSCIHQYPFITVLYCSYLKNCSRDNFLILLESILIFQVNFINNRVVNIHNITTL
uniref:C2H2-type domain-containing protein n=1 Tax=Heterorhabditis bacteriophora TaxID=37862 RepID=A0A1I7WLK5_HETBA